MIKRLLKQTHQTYKAFRAHVTKLQKESQETSTPAKLVKLTKVDTTPAQKIELTIKSATVAKIVSMTLLILLLGYVVYLISDTLLLFFISLLFAAALDPMVDALEARKIPRSIGILIIYAVLFLAVGMLIANLVPVVATQVSDLANKVQLSITAVVNGGVELPKSLAWAQPKVNEMLKGIDSSNAENYKDILLNIGQRLSDVAGNVFNVMLGIFNGLFNMVIVLVLTFMMTVDERGIDKFILSLFSAKHSEYIRIKSAAIKEKMGYWLRGQVMLCFLVGFLTYIGLFIVGLVSEPVQYATTISLVAGFTELIPYVGPIVAWLLAVPMVANQSLFLIIWLSILMYVIQTLENNLLVPLVMKKAVGISPIFVMFAMFVGYSLLGILGMLIAVPVAAAISLFVKDYADKDK